MYIQCTYFLYLLYWFFSCKQGLLWKLLESTIYSCIRQQHFSVGKSQIHVQVFYYLSSGLIFWKNKACHHQNSDVIESTGFITKKTSTFNFIVIKYFKITTGCSFLHVTVKKSTGVHNKIIDAWIPFKCFRDLVLFILVHCHTVMLYWKTWTELTAVLFLLWVVKMSAMKMAYWNK